MASTCAQSSRRSRSTGAAGGVLGPPATPPAAEAAKHMDRFKLPPPVDAELRYRRRRPRERRGGFGGWWDVPNLGRCACPPLSHGKLETQPTVLALRMRPFFWWWSEQETQHVAKQ